MDKVGQITGRYYKPYTYYGAKDAEKLVVLMGSGADTTMNVVDFLTRDGEKVGVLKVSMFRPWSAEKFMSVIPRTVKKVSVLDKT